ncbi:MAG: Holliday junction branch migration protein RuvA [Candidatus Izemoplasmatales bacterium]|nr:Holliday junction branch migration protein RuvA [Candidatus Izemoplasmatales bacterium]MDD4595503.1 Holliday junction branch migration protein RuvA [Candidatus Izemoplasmatales bacterium]
MYSYLKGTITEIRSNYVTLEVNDIGFHLLTPNPYLFTIAKETTLYIYQKVAEDEISLYGFSSCEEKELFLKLISVNGIGPKSANAILAAGSVEEIANAIESGNAKYLQKFPGIGPKASQQIILDLQGKIDVTVIPLAKIDSLSEVDDALQALGYNAKEIKKILPKLDTSKKTNELIKDALRMMLK